MQINPAMASRWLIEVARREIAIHGKLNRAIKVQRVEAYARDMRNGEWTPGPQMIIFDTDGLLADGQHRLHAIVASQTTQTFLVVRDVPRRYMLNIDRHGVRSTSDSMIIATGDASIDSQVAATCNALALHHGWGLGTKPTSSEALAIYAAYGNAIRAANAMAGHSRGVSVAPYRAALVGALQRYAGTKNFEAIGRFAAIVREGLVDTNAQADATNTALALRRTLNGETRERGSKPSAHTIFHATEYAIAAFLRGQSLKRLRVPDDQPVIFSMACPRLSSSTA